MEFAPGIFGLNMESSAGRMINEPSAVVNMEIAVIQPMAAITPYSEKSRTRKPRPTADAFERIARPEKTTA